MFIIHRVKKYHSIKNIQKHLNRDRIEYVNNVDVTRSHLNVVLSPYNPISDQELKDLYHGRKNSVTGIEGLYTASPEWFKNKNAAEIEQYFKDCLEFHKQHYGDLILNAIVHYDETTPHLHVLSVPVYNGRLNARHYCGGSKILAQNQTDVYEQVGSKYGLQRGQEHSTRAHKRTINYQWEQIQKRNEDIVKDIDMIINKRNELIQYEQVFKEKLKRMTIEQAYNIIEEQQQDLIR